MQITPPATSQQKTMWRTSSFCQQGECLEVAVESGEIALRSNRAPDLVIRLTAAEWQAFTAGVKAREFDTLG
jgi:hypothetical protein